MKVVIIRLLSRMKPGLSHNRQRRRRELFVDTSQYKLSAREATILRKREIVITL
jgi:hypothetical protein